MNNKENEAAKVDTGTPVHTPTMETAFRLMGIISPEGYEPEDLAQVVFVLANSDMALEITKLRAHKAELIAALKAVGHDLSEHSHSSCNYLPPETRYKINAALSEAEGAK